MGGGVAVEPFQHLGNADQFRDFRAGRRGLPEFGLLFHGLIQADIDGFGNQLGDGIHLRQGNIQGPAHIPDDGPGLHFSEGDDLGHIILAAVAVRYIMVDILPAVDAKIHINIRHALAARI